MRPRLLPLVCLALSLLAAPRSASAADPKSPAPLPAASPDDDLVRDGWAGDRLLAATLAERGLAQAQLGSHAAAREALAAAARLAPWEAGYAWRLCALQLRRGAVLEALGHAHDAIGIALSYPHRAHVVASLFAAVLLAWTLAIAMGGVVMTSRLAKCLVHGVVHRLGRTPGDEPHGLMRLLPAVVLTLLLVGAGWVAGPLGAGVLALVGLAPCASRPERQALVSLLAMTALFVALMAAAVGGYRQGSGVGEPRFWATQDRSAGWAREELAARSGRGREQERPRDAWARGLLALHAHNFAEADAQLRAALGSFPSEPALHVAAAEAAFERGDLERAAHALERARTLRPGSAVVHFNLSQVLLAQAKPTEAQAAREQAFARGGSQLLRDVAALERVGRLLLPPPAAAELFVDEGRPDALFWQGVLHEAELALWQPLGGALPRPLLGALAAAGALLMLFFARPLPRSGPKQPPAWPRLCNRCGAIACPSCAPAAAAQGHCAPCFGIDSGTEADLAARMAQQRRTRAARARRELRVRASAWLWPGLGLLAAGAMRKGVLWAATGGLCISLLILEPYPAGFAPFGWLAPRAAHPLVLALALGGYVAALLTARRQARAQLG